MKKKYKLLTILKKIKKNSLFNSLGTLNNEKKKLENIKLELQKLLDESSFKEGSVISAYQLKNNSFYRCSFCAYFCGFVCKVYGQASIKTYFKNH